MSVVARRIRATPERSALDAWNVVVKLISEQGSDARTELDAVGGVAACLIADETPTSSPIVVAGCGPRLRVYCLYGEDAITGDDANEDSLTWNPTEDDWMMWLPASAEDLEWVNRELKRHGRRIKAYDLERGEPDGEAARPAGRDATLAVNVEAFKNL